MFTFDDAAGFETYAAMPAHKQVCRKASRIAEKDACWDFWTKEKPAAEISNELRLEIIVMALSMT